MKKILTVIINGIGYRTEEENNAFLDADAKNLMELWNKYPHSLLDTSSLEKNTSSNCEVGMYSIGAGFKIKSGRERVSDYLENKIYSDERINDLIAKTCDNKAKIHIVGLCDDKNKYADINHFTQLYKFLVKKGVKKVYFHLITKGNVGSSKSIDVINEYIKERNVGSIATICGSSYGMDKTKDLKRTKCYIDLLTKLKGAKVLDYHSAIEKCYEKKVNDDYIPPLILDEDGIIEKNDAVIWMNYRASRSKQTIMYLLKYTNNIYTFNEIDKSLKTITLLEEEKLDNPLGVYLSKLGLTQARVMDANGKLDFTYYFDGLSLKKLENCKNVVIPETKESKVDLRVNTVGVTKEAIKVMESDFDFILVNYKIPDIIGRMGNYEETVKAIMTVDICLGKLLDEASNNFYKVIITSTNSYVEDLSVVNGKYKTSNALNRVPFIIKDNSVKLKQAGSLESIAPTILEYMDIAKPKEMKDTESLIIK